MSNKAKFILLILFLLALIGLLYAKYINHVGWGNLFLLWAATVLGAYLTQPRVK